MTTRPSGSGYVRDPFSGNQVPKARFRSFARTLLPDGTMIIPNAPGIEQGGTRWIQNNFLASQGTLLSTQDKGGLKVDHSIGQRHRRNYFMNFTRYRNEFGVGGPPGVPLPLWNRETVTFDSDVYRFSYDLALSHSVLNHFVAGGNLFNKISGSPNLDKGWKQQGICLKGAVDCDQNFPKVGFSEFSLRGSNAWNGTEQPLWSIQEDLSWIPGSHTMKFGYSYQSQRAYGIGNQNISGNHSFNRLGTSVPGQTAFRSGSSFASFLLEVAQSGDTQTANVLRELYPYHGFYAQDDWRVTKRLVLNIGLRYEFTQPPFELDDQYSDFTWDRPNPGVNGFPGALIFAGFGQGRENKRAVVPGWHGGWRPRLGLAYPLNAKTTLRTAFGRSFSKVTTPHGYGNFASTNPAAGPAISGPKLCIDHLNVKQLTPEYLA